MLRFRFSIHNIIFTLLFVIKSLVGYSDAIMDQSSPPSAAASSIPQYQQCQNNDESSSASTPTIQRRHSWSGSRKINVIEEDDITTTEHVPLNNKAKSEVKVAETSNFVSSLIAGVGSGSLASVVCAPLDLVRTRMQVAGGLQGKSAKNAKIIQSIREIYRSEGMRGCFRGLGATLATVPAFWGIYFPLYEYFKTRILDVSSSYYGDGGHNHHAMVHLSAAISAGAVADVVCNPMFVVRTRMQTEALHYFHVPVSERKPHGLISTVMNLHKEGGLPIFWRGLTASLLGLGHVGIQFPVYERLKAEARKRSPDGEESPLDLLLASGLSKMTAAIITYPHEVIRSRIMDARGPVAGLNVWQTTQHIIKHEGYAGLYVGLRVSLLRVVPNCCVTFVSYELIARWARNKLRDDGSNQTKV
jgi:solute carrier family 25 folate transporter 32